jgi:hypothetical protein
VSERSLGIHAEILGIRTGGIDRLPRVGARDLPGTVSDLLWY